MGLLNWFRRRRDEEPAIIPLQALRPPAQTFWSQAVRCDNNALWAIAEHGVELRLPFEELDRVAIRTTDEGPGIEDVFWLLTSGSQECLIPHGAAGEAELFDRLLKLPGFNPQVMIEALTSTENAEFECWSRR